MTTSRVKSLFDNAEPEIILDLSRLLSRIFHSTPTGVDRCEMAYARGLLARAPHRLSFAAVHPVGIYGRLPLEPVKDFLDALEERWQNSGVSSRRELWRFAVATFFALRPRAIKPRSRSKPAFYLQASPNNLTKPDLLAAVLRKEQARFVCLVHDFIPLKFPEYAREGGMQKHQIRIDTIVRNAHGIICNSYATLEALSEYSKLIARPVETVVAHIGTSSFPADHGFVSDQRPYFVCIGTIEPRKNHLLLLNLWRRWSEEQGPANIPKLLLIGRRGWENEQIVDMLDRCEALRGCVEEHGRLSDRDVAPILAGARALLLPSFAEGYGMPVAEALAMGTPVLCSELPALREAGGDVPEFIDPLDGPGWRQALQAYATPDAPRRNLQLQRLSGWSPPRWEDHIKCVLDLLERLA